MSRTQCTCQPAHPGAILRQDYLKPLGLSIALAAAILEVSVDTLSKLLTEEEPVTPEMALRLSQAFGTSPELWMNLQLKHDLWHAERKLAEAEEKADKAFGRLYESKEFQASFQESLDDIKASRVKEMTCEPATTITLTIVLTPDLVDGGYSVQCEEEPAAISQGETKREALINVLDALELVLGIEGKEGVSGGLDEQLGEDNKEVQP